MIKTHAELAKHVEDKSILHLNSLGKDSVLCLEWLARTKVKKVISVFFEFLAPHPADDMYFDYLRKRFPQFTFCKAANTVELSLICDGTYQSPLDIHFQYNHFEYVEFERGKQIEELKKHFECDFVCDGSSKYESFARRVKFHQKGLEFKGVIYPLGMMSKDQVISLIRDTGIKLHPCYKTASGTYDHPSYWKMRAGLLANEQFYKNVLRYYPLFVLDKYRYERMLK